MSGGLGRGRLRRGLGSGGRGDSCKPVLGALAVQGVHPGRLERHRGVLEACELVHQHGPLRLRLRHRLCPGSVCAFGINLAVFGRLGGVVGGTVGIFRGGGQRLGGRGGVLGCLEGPAAICRDGFKSGGLLQGIAVAADKSAQCGIEPAVAVQIPGELPHLFAGLCLFRFGGRGLRRRERGGIPADLEGDQRITVRIVGLHGRREAGLLGCGGVRQDPVDPGDLVRRRAFTGLGRSDLFG